jgi:hypothetical protein
MISGHGNLDTAVAQSVKGRSISSRSRSRPSACCTSSTARLKPTGFGARTRRFGHRSGHDDQLHGTSVAINTCGHPQAGRTDGQSGADHGPAGVGKESPLG